MITEKQLQQFCATEDIRFYLLTPYIQDGYVVASNGHICIRTMGEFKSALTHTDIKPVSITQLIDKTISLLSEVGFVSLPDIPPPVPCKLCEGRGHLFLCPSCDGEGEFDDGACETCGGSGVSLNKAHEIRECLFCDGAGEDLSEPVACGDSWFRRRYLDMINSLPGAAIKTNGEMGVAYFRFDGGDGAVMPTRK